MTLHRITRESQANSDFRFGHKSSYRFGIRSCLGASHKQILKTPFNMTSSCIFGFRATRPSMESHDFLMWLFIIMWCGFFIMWCGFFFMWCGFFFMSRCYFIMSSGYFIMSCGYFIMSRYHFIMSCGYFITFCGYFIMWFRLYVLVDFTSGTKL